MALLNALVLRATSGVSVEQAKPSSAAAISNESMLSELSHIPHAEPGALTPKTGVAATSAAMYRSCSYEDVVSVEAFAVGWLLSIPITLLPW